MAPALKKHKNSPVFEATGELIVNHLDESKDMGLYQCIVNDFGHIKSITSNVKRIIGEYLFYYTK